MHGTEFLKAAVLSALRQYHHVVKDVGAEVKETAPNSYPFLTRGS